MTDCPSLLVLSYPALWCITIIAMWYLLCLVLSSFVGKVENPTFPSDILCYTSILYLSDPHINLIFSHTSGITTSQLYIHVLCSAHAFFSSTKKWLHLSLAFNGAALQNHKKMHFNMGNTFEITYIWQKSKLYTNWKYNVWL